MERTTRTGASMTSRLAGVVLVTALFLPGARASGANAPPTQTNAGRHCETIASRFVDRDGDTHYVFKDGSRTGERIIPRAGFDATTASQSRLAKLGLPARPARTSHAFVEWLWNYGGKANWAPPIPSCTDSRVRNDFGSINWGGYASPDNGVTFYDGILGTIKSPATYDTTTCTSASYSSWLGISSSLANPSLLIQEGIYLTYTTSPATRGTFWEIVGGPADTGGQVSGGLPWYSNHNYYFDLHIVDTSHILFYMKDSTRNVAWSYTYVMDPRTSAYTYEGYSTDAIVERPTFVTNTGVAFLAPYIHHSTDTFSGVKSRIRNGAYHTLQSLSPAKVTLWNSAHQTIADAAWTSPTSNIFNANWHRCG